VVQVKSQQISAPAAAHKYDLHAPANLQDPFPMFARLRAEDPLYRMGEPYSFWLLSRYDDVRQAMRDSQHLSNNNSEIMERRAESLPASARPSFEVCKRLLLRHIQALDAPAHTAQRQTVMKAFTPLVTNVIKSSLERRVNDLLDNMERSATCDFISDFAKPLPSQAISDIVGIPDEYRELMVKAADLQVSFVGAIMRSDDAQVERIAEQIQVAEAVLLRLFEERRREPKADLISALVNADTASLGMSENDIVVLSMFMFVAGQETTVNLLGGSLRFLLSDRRQWEHLCAAPELWPGAVEELLRFVSPVLWVQRVATEDIEMRGQLIRKGEEVVMGIGSANHDPEKFSNPEVLDVTRKNVSSVAFGYGPHTCLGAALARMETEVALLHLSQRMPQIQLRTDQFEYEPVFFLRSLKSLPVAIRS
jgi:cytochrome P450